MTFLMTCINDLVSLYMCVCVFCRVNDAVKLKELITTARFARCRSRFVMPVILYENKVGIIISTYMCIMLCLCNMCVALASTCIQCHLYLGVWQWQINGTVPVLSVQRIHVHVS